MKRVIITTCGTSLLQSSCWDIGPIKDKHFSQMKDEDERQKHELKCKTVLTATREDGANISEKFNRFSWDNINYLRDLSAELASIRAIQMFFKESTEGMLGKDDIIILLHSNNKDGKFCAERLHEILTNKSLILLPEVQVKQWQVEGLDPRDSREFEKALNEIWSQSIKNFPRINEIQYIFNLTGGYKGVAILLGAFAYAKGLDAKIFYLYEESEYKNIAIIDFNPNTDTPGFNKFRVKNVDLMKTIRIHIPDEK
jgi:putative CRISPR-associated protein (TIGR02619 family)